MEETADRDVRIEVLDESLHDAFVALVVEIEDAGGRRDAAGLDRLRASVRATLAARHADADEGWTRLVARADERLVGYASCVIVPKLDERRGFLFVDELFVLERSRRRGVATRLVDAAVERARVLGLAGVRLLARPENEAARALYRRAGFDEHDTVFLERSTPPLG